MSNKETKIYVRLTTEEKKKIEAEAEKQGLTKSEYVRKKVFNKRKIKSPSKV